MKMNALIPLSLFAICIAGFSEYSFAKKTEARKIKANLQTPQSQTNTLKELTSSLNDNCIINIHMKLNTGEEENSRYSFKLKNKSECIDMFNTYKSNSLATMKREVTYKWISK